MTAEEINALRLRALEERLPLLNELAALEPDQLIERLLQEPLLERHYWHTHFARGQAKNELNSLKANATDDDLVDTQIILTRVNMAVQRAAQRYYGYPGFEAGPEEEILAEMIEKSGGAPLAIIFHAYDRALLAYR